MSMDKKAKLRAINNAIKSVEKQLKAEGLCRRLGDEPPMQYDIISSGSMALDLAVGCKGLDPTGKSAIGLARGRVYEIFGAESSGKSLICQKIISEFQKHDLICAYIDAEMTFAPDFARKLGVDPDEIFLSQPDNMEDAFTVMDALIDSKGVDCIVLDSVAALAPKAELDGEIGKATMALVARVMSPFLRRIIPKCAKNNVTVIFVNQIRDNVGVMFGDPTTTPGGRLVA